MKKIYKKWSAIVFLLLFIIFGLINYYLDDGDLIIIPIVVIGLLPGALKSLGYEISRKIEITSISLAIIGLIWVVIITFF
tara:strand:+ start:41 stop:280 length:240 start_codon:yes stop_codon:yes gene_type:complete